MRETCVNAINKMIESIDKVFKYTNDMSYEDFAKNDMVIDATVFSICLIGENVKKLVRIFKISIQILCGMCLKV